MDFAPASVTQEQKKAGPDRSLAAKWSAPGRCPFAERDWGKTQWPLRVCFGWENPLYQKKGGSQTPFRVPIRRQGSKSAHLSNFFTFGCQRPSEPWASQATAHGRVVVLTAATSKPEPGLLLPGLLNPAIWGTPQIFSDFVFAFSDSVSR